MILPMDNPHPLAPCRDTLVTSGCCFSASSSIPAWSHESSGLNPVNEGLPSFPVFQTSRPSVHVRQNVHPITFVASTETTSDMSRSSTIFNLPPPAWALFSRLRAALRRLGLFHGDARLPVRTNHNLLVAPLEL